MINNRYSILNKVGEGRSQVFCCKDKYHPGEKFAIKILSSKADCKEESLFIEEYFTLFKLNHPNIIKVAGKGTVLLCDENETELFSIETGCHFFVMEYFDGEIISGTDWVRNEENLRAIIIQLASVLLYLHHSNYIYNDIKAENILLKVESGHPVIKFIDFGLAWNIADKENIPVAGTIHYLAPEILQGGKASIKSDLFSLGALLFKLIYNKFPFEGNSESEILTSIINSEPSYSLVECSESIINILKRLLAKDPGKRYHSSLEILYDLGEDHKKQIFNQWFPAKVLISREENSLITNYLKDESRFDVLLLTGSEGSGKTTLLNCLVFENQGIIYVGPNENLITGNQLIEEIIFHPSVYNKLEHKTLEEAILFLKDKKSTDQHSFHELKLLLIKVCSEVPLAIAFDDFGSYDTYTMTSLIEIIQILQSKKSKVIITDTSCNKLLSESIYNISGIGFQPFSNEQTYELLNLSFPEFYPVEDIYLILSEYYGLTPGDIFNFIRNLYENDIFNFLNENVIINKSYQEFEDLLLGQTENYRRIFGSLSAEEIKVLEYCSMLAGNIYADILAGLLNISLEKMNELIERLELKGILKIYPNVQGVGLSSERFKSFIYSSIENKSEKHHNVALFLECTKGGVNHEEIARQFEYSGDYERSFNILWERLLAIENKDLSKFQKEILVKISEFPIEEEKLFRARLKLCWILQKLGENKQCLDLIRRYQNNFSASYSCSDFSLLEGIALVEVGEPEKGKLKLEVLNGSLQDEEMRLTALLYLAYAEFDLGQFDDACSKCNVLTMFLEKYPEIAGKGYNLLGLIELYYNNDLNCAIKNFENALNIYVKADLPMQVAAVEVNIGNIYNMQGNFDAAEQHWRNSLQINSSIGNLDQEAKVLLNLGILFYDKSEFLRAISQYKDAQFIFSNLGNKLSEGLTNSNLGEVYLSICEYTNSFRSLTRAKEIFSEVKSTTELIETEFLLGKFYFQIGDTKRLGTIIENLYSLIKENSPNEKHNEYIRYLKSLKLVLEGNIDEPIMNLNSIKESFFSFSGRNDFLTISLLLSNLLIIKGHYSEAIAELNDERFEKFCTFNIYVNAEKNLLFSKISAEAKQAGLKSKFEHLNNAYLLVEDQNISEITWKVLYFMAVNFFERGNLNKAETFSNYASSVLLYIAGQFEEEEMRKIYLSAPERKTAMQRLNNIQEHISCN